MKKIIGILIALSAVTFSKDLTLESAIDMGLENGKTIKTAELKKKNSTLNVRRVFKTALPRVTYTGTYDVNEFSTANANDVINGQIVSSDSKSGYVQTIGIYQPLFQGGSITGGILGARATKNMSEIYYLAEKRDVRLDIIETYSNIIKYEKDLTVLAASKKELETRYNKQKEQLALKLITKVDLLKTEVSILDVEAQITGKKTDLTIAKKDLRTKLNLPKNEELNLKEFEIPKKLLAGVNLENDLAKALTNSLSARLTDSQVDLSKAEEIVARSGLLPQVQAFATYGGIKAKSFGDTFEDSEWRGGVQVNWDVFNFGSGLNELSVAKNSTEISRIEKEETIDNMILSITSAYETVERLEKLRESRAKALEASKESLEIDSERYSVGLISTTDYLQTEKEYREAAVNYNDALLDYYIAFEKYRSLLI